MRVLPAQLARCEDEQVKRNMDANLGRRTTAIVKRWLWSESALSGLAVLLQSRQVAACDFLPAVLVEFHFPLC